MRDYALLKQVYFKLPAADDRDLSPDEWARRLNQLRKTGAMSFDIVLMLLRFSKLLLNKDDISPIFKGQRFRNHRSFQVSLASFRADAATAQLMDSRYLAPGPYNLQELLQFPPGSLGHEYARHMQDYKLEVVFYPPLEDKQDDDIAYLRKRARQTHDIHHVVLGFPAIDSGEMAISAFYLSQHNVPLSALLIGFGFLYAILRQPERIDELMRAIQLGWQIGQQAEKFFGVRWEDHWLTPLEEVRQLLKVPPPRTVFP